MCEQTEKQVLQNEQKGYLVGGQDLDRAWRGEEGSTLSAYVGGRWRKIKVSSWEVAPYLGS